MAELFHITPEGPKRCSVDESNPRSSGCKYGSGGHFSDYSIAEEAFAESMGGALPESSSKESSIELRSNLGVFEVEDGNLGDPRARAALSSGLCGDLALAIHEKTGSPLYMLSYTVHSEEEMAKLFEEDPDHIVYSANHIVAGSPSRFNCFVDSYGQQSYESLEANYGDASLVEITPEMARHFAAEGDYRRLNRFADSAIELDIRNDRYEINEDDLYDGSEDSNQEEEKLVALELDFGSKTVVDGDLSDPEVRYLMANGLCGDLALAIQRKTGGQAYFLCSEEDDLEEARRTGRLPDLVAHAVIESPHRPGEFLDGYGRKTEAEIKDFYGFNSLKPVSPELLESYGSGASNDLSNFAEAALELDRSGIGYSYREYSN